MSDYQPVNPTLGQVPQPAGQPGYPPPSGQPGFPPPPPPGYPAPPQQQKFSGLAIAGFILSFLGGLLGFVLSLIAIFQTGKGKKRGRGLAVAGVIISVVVAGLSIVVVTKINNSTIADPACANGKNAILNNSQSDLTPDKVQSIISGLNAAAAEAKHDDVRTAMKAASADYSQLLQAMKTGNPPAGLEDKLTTDLNAIDDLCTIGS